MKLIALALCLAALAHPAAAQDALLTAVSGKVWIIPAGQKRPVAAKKGDALIFGDGLRTSSKAIAHLSLERGGMILVQENSRLVLEGDGDNPVANFSLGEFLVGLAKKLEAGRSFKVHTPAAVAAVRGTLFWGKTDKAKQATFAGFGHEISVTAQGKSVTVGPGQTVTVDFGKAPPEPKPHAIPKSYLQTFAVKGSISGLDALADEKIK